MRRSAVPISPFEVGREVRMPKKKSRPPSKVAYSDEEGGEPNDEVTLDAAGLFNPAATPSVSGVEDDVPVPCGISGLGSAATSGAMGFVFGGGGSNRARLLLVTQFDWDSSFKLHAGGQMIRHRGPGRWKAVTTEGFNSTKVWHCACSNSRHCHKRACRPSI